MIKTLRYFLKVLLILLSPLLLYLLLALVGAIIPVNKNVNPKTGKIDIYLLRQDMHTDIILPVHSEMIQWDAIFKLEHTIAKPEKPKFIGFGWGDLNFYKNTPQWKDLKLDVAFKALFLKSQSALHTQFYQKIPTSKNPVKISVNQAQYKILSDYILETVAMENLEEIMPISNLHYYRNDAFYLAKNSFSLFKTCNTWTNSALKSSGLQACLWTPFPQGIFLHY